MKKKIFTFSGIIGIASMPAFCLLSCGGTSATTSAEISPEELADNVAQKVALSTSSVLTIDSFPAANLHDVKSQQDLGLILPQLYPETPLSVKAQSNYLFVLNKDVKANTALIEVSASAGYDNQTVFTKHYWFTINNFNARLDLSSINDLTVNPGDDAVNSWNNRTDLSSTDLVTGLNALVLKALQNQVISVTASNYETLTWAKDGGAALDNTTDVKNKSNTFQATITAKANDPYLKNQKVPLKVTIPQLNQLKLSQLQNTNVDAKYFSDLTSKSSVSRSEIEARLRNFIVDFLQNLSVQQQLGLTITSDDFATKIEKNNNKGYLDNPTDLTKGSTIVDVHIYANLRNPNLIGQFDDWLITIPTLT